MRTSTRFLGLSALVFTSICAGALAQGSQPRQVAAPASDILTGVVRLPDPASTPTISSAAMLPLAFTRTPNVGWSAQVSLPVERAGELALALLSPDAGRWRVLAGIDGGALRPIATAFALERRTASAGEGLSGWIVDRYDVRAAPAGRWTIRVEADDVSGARAPAPGWLIARPEGELRIEAFVTTHRLVSDEPIGIVARIDAAASGNDELHIDSATAWLESSGTVQELALHDDGLHEDGARGDGLFGALVPASTRGDVRARVELAGSIDGAQFVRTAQLVFPVLERRALLDGSVDVEVIDERRVRFEIGALLLAPVQRLHVSAEVWGRDAAGAAVPVCWLSRQAEPRERAGVWTLPLDLDLRWLDVADASGPLELRAVRVQDPDTEVVFDSAVRLAVAEFARPARTGERARAITRDMLLGSAPTTLGLGASSPSHTAASRLPKPIVPALMLVHGYCSGGSIWPAADFTQPKVVFLDPDANRTHDAFAQLIDAKARASNVSTFGVVGHSQGGAAALHLLTYYQSGLDFASGARRIQSVATPYQGTPLASLGAFACGVNNNMTPNGSANWLAGIPTWARAEVFFWTTQDAGSNCNALTSLFLANPEDGTVEKFRGDLPGGNSMGHVSGWCHTTGMSFPANYTDHARNQEMNAAAAR